MGSKSKKVIEYTPKSKLPNPEKLLKINSDNLGKEFEEFALKKWPITFLEAHAKHKRDTLESKRDRVYARLFKQIKSQSGKEKATDGSIKQEILITPKYREAQEEYEQAKLDYLFLKGLREDMNDKLESLRSMSARLKNN